MRIIKVGAVVLMSLLLSACSSAGAADSGKAGISKPSFPVRDTVVFDYNEAVLTQESTDRLDKQIDWLKQYPKTIANIEGHCDARGTEEYNIALGARRAEGVKDYMINHGIDGNRLAVISYGKSKPAVNGDGEDAWKYNRRAVTFVPVLVD